MKKASPKRLGDLIQLKRGYDLPESKRTKGPYPVISSAGISGFHSEYKVDGKGVVIGRYGTLGEAHYVDGKYWPHNTSLYVTDFKENCPRYIYYLLTCIGRIRTSDKSAVPGVNRNELHEMAVPAISDKVQQESIANALSLLDKRIENNNQIIQETEAMSRLLYEYWFVQFDFPISAMLAKTLGNPKLEGRPYRESGAPMRVNESLGRDIPACWTDQKVSSMIDTIRTGDWGADKKTDSNPIEVYCIRGTDIRSLNGLGVTLPPSRFISAKSATKFLKPNDLVIEISGGAPDQSTGRASALTPHVFARFNKPLVCSNFCKAVALANDTGVFFFYHTWSYLYDHRVFFNWEGKTSGIKNFLFESFSESHSVVKPDNETAVLFEKVLGELERGKQNAIMQNSYLRELRDWLLPLLMSGQVSVR
jgi:type I restriction enzyme S subunit